MRRLTNHFAIASLTFTVGVLSGAFWYAGRKRSVKPTEFQLNQGNVVCPDWYGLIDLDEAKLIYFEGRSG